MFGSSQWKLAWPDVKSAAMTAVIAGAATGGYLFLDQIKLIDWGTASPVISMAIAFGLKLLDRYRRDTR